MESQGKLESILNQWKENENITHQNLWHPDKEVLEMKFILWNSTEHLKKK